MIKKIILFLVLLSTCSSAKITLHDISLKPESRAKDFMIWQFLKQDITAKQADSAYSQAKNTKNYKLRRAYLKKTKNKDIKFKLDCASKSNLMKIKDKDCLKIAFTPYKATKLTNKQRDNLSSRFDSNSTINLLHVLNEEKTIESYKQYDSNTVLTLLRSTGKAYRKKYLNISLDANFLNSLAGSWKISSFVKMVVFDDSLDKLQFSLLDMDATELNSKTSFLLALNSLKHGDTKNATRFFIAARDAAIHKIDVDKNNFWLYQLTQDKQYLNKLLLSMDINVYTLYEKEKKSIEFDNYFITLNTNDEKNTQSITNPFHWDQILKKIKATKKDELFSLAKNYQESEMLPVQALITQKAYNHNMHSYIMPYDEHLQGLNLDTKALIYSLMRQESRMIPAALSRSYALGLMQIMPFVTDDISKRIKDPIKSYDDMFKPCYNIRYSRAHIKWMQKSLYHPLFMAYAYNGGLTFFKNYLLDGHFTDSKYEPFLSMEMMAQGETREYGKKVLANYVMYKKIMGDEVSIVHLFDILKEPKKTDCFRKKG